MEEPWILLTNTNTAWRLSNHRLRFTRGDHMRNQFYWLLVVRDQACDFTKSCISLALIVFIFWEMLQILKASDADQWVATHKCLLPEQSLFTNAQPPQSSTLALKTSFAACRSGSTCSRGFGWWQTWNLILSGLDLAPDYNPFFLLERF